MSMAISSLVKALSRSLKAAGYYDDAHPILAQVRKQALDALQQSCQNAPNVTIGTIGSKLVVDPTAAPLSDPASVQLAEHLFARSIVAIRLEKSAGPKDLAGLMASLGETVDKARAAGGYVALLERQQVQGIVLVEVDFDALFTGRDVQISDVAGQDQVVERTLRDVLKIKDKRAQVGDAVGIDIAALTTPESLGGFLDELLDKAEPGVVDQPGNAGGPAGSGGPGSGSSQAGKSAGVASGKVKSRIGGGGNVRIEALNPDDLAELAAKAWYGHHQYMRDAGTPKEALADSAKLMASVMARLRPDARFVMLQKLTSRAQSENPPESVKQGNKSLSQTVSDGLLVEAIQAMLSNQGTDPEMVQAVADLMQQIRPIESERKRLLAELDSGMKKTGHPVDGIIWQELQSKALKSNGLGMLELSFRETMDSLVVAAQERIQLSDGPGPVRQALDTLQPEAILARYKDIWMGVMTRMTRPPDSLLASGTDLAKVLEVQKLDKASSEVLAFLLRQSERTTQSSALHIQLREYFSGADGSRRAVQVAKDYECRGPVIAEAMLDALESPVDTRTKEMLLERFKGIDQAGLNSIAVMAQNARPIRVFNLIRIGYGLNPRTGSQIARLGLRNRDDLAKEMALKALADYPVPETFTVLAAVAGVNSDEEAQKLLHLDPKEPTTEKRLRNYQSLSISILGSSQASGAVRSLWNLLTREAGFGKGHIDQFRPLVAKALSANATREARAALAAGLNSKNKAVREACSRYAKEAGG